MPGKLVATTAFKELRAVGSGEDVKSEGIFVGTGGGGKFASSYSSRARVKQDGLGVRWAKL